VPGLRRMRNERGYSLNQLSALTGITDAQLWRIESGNGRTSLTTLGKLAAVLRVDSLEELLRADEDAESTAEKEEELLAVP
jgi:transcriptional regulator with XRE-family HTH domain